MKHWTQYALDNYKLGGGRYSRRFVKYREKLVMWVGFVKNRQKLVNKQ